MRRSDDKPEGINRRGVLRAAVAGGAAAAIAGGVGGGLATATGAAAAPARPLTAAGVAMRWLGVAGWEITFDGHVLYFDPYVSRFDYTTNGGILAPNPAVVDNLLTTGRLAGPPELMMVSHSHWDHIADVPQLLSRAEWAGATIRTIGTDTQRNLLTAMGVSAGRMANFITASGGEDLTFQGGAYQVRVMRSLHSQSLGYGYFAPGIRVEPPATPKTTTDLVEGNTLAYQLTVPGRLKVLMFGGTNFVEKELEGLRPDVVSVCVTDFSSLDHYLERLLTVLGGPRYVIPVHNDDMVTGYDSPDLPKTIDRTPIDQLKKTVQSMGLKTQVVEPTHLRVLNF
ncbi:hypothetical protein GCM10023322_37450 [Rugosimonospora acidiphila]|uniref:MBL fold metallo-hydrolase n=1 Tax=Rugosimonospora acidiphila TaxID=556531 RepID=A0ABP9RWN6_9ACTN